MRKPKWVPVGPAWWPEWLCVSSLSLWAVMIGFGLGALLSWWLYRDEPRWLHFHYLVASYLPQSLSISVVGEFDVVRPCNGHVIWRIEVVSRHGGIVRHAPLRDPGGTTGRHLYSDRISLPVPIRPDGWHAIAIVTCANDTLEIVASPESPVVIEMPKGG